MIAQAPTVIHLTTKIDVRNVAEDVGDCRDPPSAEISHTVRIFVNS